MRLGHVEEDRVRVELRSRVAVNRARSVMLELCHRPVTSVFRRAVAAHACLNVALHPVDGDANGLAMRLSYPLVTSDERGQRYALRRRERRIPRRPMAHRLDG